MNNVRWQGNKKLDDTHLKSTGDKRIKKIKKKKLPDRAGTVWGPLLKIDRYRVERGRME